MNQVQGEQLQQPRVDIERRRITNEIGTLRKEMDEERIKCMKGESLDSSMEAAIQHSIEQWEQQLRALEDSMESSPFANVDDVNEQRQRGLPLLAKQDEPLSHPPGSVQTLEVATHESTALAAKATPLFKKAYTDGIVAEKEQLSLPPEQVANSENAKVPNVKVRRPKKEPLHW